jgi:hypothetical protein
MGVQARAGFAVTDSVPVARARGMQRVL